MPEIEAVIKELTSSKPVPSDIARFIAAMGADYWAAQGSVTPTAIALANTPGMSRVFREGFMIRAMSENLDIRYRSFTNEPGQSDKIEDLSNKMFELRIDSVAFNN